jgi:hypothetical protein
LVVGSSNLSGRANFPCRLSDCLIFGRRLLFQHHQCRSFAGLAITNPICCFYKFFKSGAE